VAPGIVWALVVGIKSLESDPGGPEGAVNCTPAPCRASKVRSFVMSYAAPGQNINLYVYFSPPRAGRSGRR
jgi:hypothetical protein